MAFITVDLVEGCLTSSQKQDLIHALTDAVVSVAGESVRDVIVVKLCECADGHLAVGDLVVTGELLMRRTLLSGSGPVRASATEKEKEQ